MREHLLFAKDDRLQSVGALSDVSTNCILALNHPDYQRLLGKVVRIALAHRLLLSLLRVLVQPETVPNGYARTPVVGDAAHGYLMLGRGAHTLMKRKRALYASACDGRRVEDVPDNDSSF